MYEKKAVQREQLFSKSLLGLVPSKTKVVDENQAKACYEKNTRKVT